MQVLAQPGGEGGFVQFAGGQGKHVGHAVGIFRSQGVAIECQEQFRYDKRGALVAVNEGVVAGDAKRITCRQVGGIGLSVMGQLLRAGQRRLQQATVACACRAAMFGQLPFVQRQRQRPEWQGRAA